MTLDRLLDDAVEGGQRIGENGRPCGQRDPLSAFEPAGTVHPAASAEAVGQRLVARREQVHRERAGLSEAGQRRGRTRKADE